MNCDIPAMALKRRIMSHRCCSQQHRLPAAGAGTADMAGVAVEVQPLVPERPPPVVVIAPPSNHRRPSS